MKTWVPAVKLTVLVQRDEKLSTGTDPPGEPEAQSKLMLASSRQSVALPVRLTVE